MSAVACRPDGSDSDVLFFMQPQGINSWSVIGFLEALHEEIPGPKVLLWDGLAAHHSRIVKEHISGYDGLITAERFPAYAPELNPVEYLFSALRRKDTGNFCPETLEQIADKLSDAVERIGNQENVIHGFLKASTLFTKQELVA